jgi:hypothetical protein
MVFVQAMSNPFDIPSRLEVRKIPQEKVTTPSLVVQSLENPFDVVRGAAAVTVADASSRAIEKTIIEIKPVVDDAKDVPRKFGIALLTLLPLAFLFTAFRPFFVKSYINVISITRLGQSLRDVNSTALIANTLWYIATLINMGIFLALVLRYHNISMTSNIFFDVLLGISLVATLVLAKHLVLLSLRLIFPIAKEVRLYEHLIVSFGIALGALLVPLNIGLLYAEPNIKIGLLWVGVALIALFYAWRAIRGIILGNQFITSYGFHFLLYICAVEIVPTLMIAKLALIAIG